MLISPTGRRTAVGLPMWVPPLLYAVVLALSVSPQLAAVLMVLAGGMAALTGLLRISVNRIFLVVLFMTVFKAAYYFLLNDFPSTDVLRFWDAEGRMFVALVILLIVSGQSYSAYQLRAAFRWMIRLYLLWVPILFAIRTLGFGGQDESSHHQLGVSALSGFALILITRGSRGIGVNLALLAIAFMATAISGSRTAVLSAMLMLAYMLWVQLRLTRKAATKAATILVVVGAVVAVGAAVLLAGPKVEVGKRTYDFGAYRYVGAAVLYGMRHPDAFSQAIEGRRDAQVVGGDANIVGRGVVWGKAIAHFIESPIIGMGVGRFDDAGTCSRQSLLFCVHDQGESNYAGSTAHNAVLHVMAEEGLAGTALMAWFVALAVTAIRARRRQIAELGWDSGAVSAYWLALLFSSMFQHVLASPLYAITFFVPLLALGCLKVKLPTTVPGRVPNRQLQGPLTDLRLG